MKSKLPINLEELLRQNIVEGERIEYKKGWNPDPIIRTICAFANDFENLGGGYIVIGQDCDDAGRPIFPPVGLPDNLLDKIQQELLSYCYLIQPNYFPIISIEKYQDRNLIILWIPGGQNRPYKAPKAVTATHKSNHYYIRRYSSTVEAKDEYEQELLSLAASIPFDDRMCQTSSIEDLRLPIIRAYLKDIDSGIYPESAGIPLVELSRQMAIIDGPNEYVKPRNIGILFFNESPDKFIPGSQIDVVTFPKGVDGGELIERTFKGPIHQQLRDVLQYIQNTVLIERVIKDPKKAEATRIYNYPYAALEEALVNAVYHRSYEQREPIEVRINPKSIEILSYPGPHPSIKIEGLNSGSVVARRYRNRRIGDFLKELKLTEGRSTGIPTIRRSLLENGSPAAKFSTDEDRSYFLVELFSHPEVTPEVTPEVAPEVTPEVRLIQALNGEMTRGELQKALKLKDAENFRKNYLLPALENALIKMTIPDKPQSSRQRYFLTKKGLRMKNSTNS